MFNKGKKIILSVIAIIVIFAGIAFGYSSIQQKNYEKNIELGINYLREEKYEEAILAFEKALSIDNKNEDIKEYLELSKVYKEIVEAEAAGDYDKLEELIEKINGMKYIDIVNENVTAIKVSSNEKEYNEKIELGKIYIGEDKITDSILTFESAMNIEYENNEASEYRDVVKLYKEIVQEYNNQQYDKALELIENISSMKYSNLVDSKVQSIKNAIEETKRKVEEEQKKKEEEARKKEEEERKNSLQNKNIIGTWKNINEPYNILNITESEYCGIPYTILESNNEDIVIKWDGKQIKLCVYEDGRLGSQIYNSYNGFYSGAALFNRIN